MMTFYFTRMSGVQILQVWKNQSLWFRYCVLCCFTLDVSNDVSPPQCELLKEKASCQTAQAVLVLTESRSIISLVAFLSFITYASKSLTWFLVDGNLYFLPVYSGCRCVRCCGKQTSASGESLPIGMWYHNCLGCCRQTTRHQRVYGCCFRVRLYWLGRVVFFQLHEYKLDARSFSQASSIHLYSSMRQGSLRSTLILIKNLGLGNSVPQILSILHNCPRASVSKTIW